MGNAFTEIAAGLQEAISHAKGQESAVVEHKPEILDDGELPTNHDAQQDS